MHNQPRIVQLSHQRLVQFSKKYQEIENLSKKTPKGRLQRGGSPKRRLSKGEALQRVGSSKVMLSKWEALQSGDSPKKL
jgi:hypothetical protein